MARLQELADELGADERTLRRAASQGTLRCRRTGPRRLRIMPGEHAYLRDHWDLIAELRKALRTKRNVRLVVLYGSTARGDDDETSDVDLLIDFAEDSPRSALELTAHLERIVGRRVGVARLDRVETHAPLLLLQALDEGRPLVDRDATWPRLLGKRRAIKARADRAYQREIKAGARALEALTR